MAPTLRSLRPQQDRVSRCVRMPPVWWSKGLLLVLITLIPLPAAAELSRGDAQCRRGLAFAVRRHSLRIVRQLELCHFKRVLGHLPSDTDCNSLLNLPSPRVVSKIEASVAHLAKTHCRDAGPPSSIGFNECPAPCNAITISNYQDVAECLVCTTREQATQTVAFALGTPPVGGPSSDVTKCVDAVSKALRKTLAKRVEQERRCQYLVDLARINVATDCRTADLSGVVEVAVERSHEYLARCKGRARTVVGGCASMRLSDVQTCFTGAVAQRAASLMERVYDPLVTDQ